MLQIRFTGWLTFRQNVSAESRPSLWQGGSLSIRIVAHFAPEWVAQFRSEWVAQFGPE